MQDKEDFSHWVTTASRTNDELLTVELLIERMRFWPHWPFRDRRVVDFEEQMKLKKERRFNPAYRPFLAMDELEALQELRDSVTHFDAST